MFCLYMELKFMGNITASTTGKMKVFEDSGILGNINIYTANGKKEENNIAEEKQARGIQKRLKKKR